MIFAEIEYHEDYLTFHAELAAYVRKHFERVKSGLQSDSWIWILDGEEKVAIDTFTSMKHQVKSPRGGAHVQAVIAVLEREYTLSIREKPELEGYEDDDE